MLDSPDSFIWSVFRLQPTETEQAVAGKRAEHSRPAKITHAKSHFWPSDARQLGPLPPAKVSDGTQRKDTGPRVANAVIQTNRIIL